MTPVGGFLLSTAIFGGAVTGEILASIALIVAGIALTLRDNRQCDKMCGVTEDRNGGHRGEIDFR